MSWSTPHHRAGVDGPTGEERHAHVFVAVLGASNYTYAETAGARGSPIGSAHMMTVKKANRSPRFVPYDPHPDTDIAPALAELLGVRPNTLVRCPGERVEGVAASA